jgi:hypothetical protein
MWFLLGALVGALMGCLVCVRYLRREIAADIGPRLQRIQLQLDNLETGLNLALVTRYADLAGRLPQEPVAIPSPAIQPRPRLSEPPFGTYRRSA